VSDEVRSTESNSTLRSTSASTVTNG